jgi:hypothetical protein
MWNSISNFRVRNAAALALVGWYLMVPLIKDGQARDLPIAEWVHVDSFDTAKDCRDGAFQGAYRAARLHGKTSDEYKAAMSFECIATDDPRLKGN